MKNDSLRTYQTRPALSSLAEEILQACADLFAHIERTLFADICKGKASHTESQQDNSMPFV